MVSDEINQKQIKRCMVYRYFALLCLVGVIALTISGCGKKSEPPEEESLAEKPVKEADTTDENEADEMETDSKAKLPTFSLGSSSTGKYVVQACVYKSPSRANRLKEKLANQGFQAYVADVVDPVPDLTGTYYRVRIGSFATIEEARTFGEEKLRPLQYDFWVDKKANDHKGGPGYPSSTSTPSSEPATESEEESEWESVD
jgi:cell division septation protein DedD